MHPTAFVLSGKTIHHHRRACRSFDESQINVDGIKRSGKRGGRVVAAPARHPRYMFTAGHFREHPDVVEWWLTERRQLSQRRSTRRTEGAGYMVRRGSMVAVLMVVTAGTAFAGQASTAGASKAPPQKPVQRPRRTATARRRVQLTSLPPAVRATVETETKSATLKGISKEKDKGRPFTSSKRWSTAAPAI